MNRVTHKMFLALRKPYPVSFKIKGISPHPGERRLMAGAPPLERQLDLAATLGTIAIKREEIKAPADGGAA